MRRWYVVQTQPRKERLAERHLLNQGFETFCPARKRARRVGTRVCITFDAFFPNYLFVVLDIERERWRSVNGTVGVISILCFGSSPAALPTPLPHGLVERLRAVCGKNGELNSEDLLVPGDRVRIVGGAFDRLCGVLEKAADTERATILLEILSRETRVEIDRARLIAA